MTKIMCITTSLKCKLLSRTWGVLVFGLWVFFGCVKDPDYKMPETNCTNNLTANASYAEVKGLYVDKTLQIQEELIIEGYVNSSDQSGNFFGVLHFQDRPANPTEGFQIELDVRDTHLFFPVGSKILIALKGLYLGKSKGGYKLGGQFTSFGNISVGRLPATVMDRHLYRDCADIVTIEPKTLEIEEVDERYANTLVRFKDLEVREDQLGLPFANPKEATSRTLVNCLDEELIMLNSGYADFQAEQLPALNG
ncbi:MAG: DUF5689 domain-containing protein, partial [Arenibacter sp.]|nr:DUF5689 domain-containing protein [Arenibacter sp.]